MLAPSRTRIVAQQDPFKVGVVLANVTGEFSAFFGVIRCMGSRKRSA
jgi:hypothetical protein